ncbi:hypothetical protein QAD02_017011 [Eretmocerus hayati]|uniref:Uncharacterized protein n=1 Tax=Eretmocerus hayati TaxID=131215 RepID=A0ACC2PD56_9HYME|nr:hypothetical protein QAD02_017011 [Eretmocerus hayati]
MIRGRGPADMANTEVVDVNIKYGSNSCLHYAVQKNDLEMAKILINCGTKIDVFNKWGCTPLHLAVSKDLDLVKLLIDNRADVNAVQVPLPLKKSDDMPRMVDNMIPQNMMRDQINERRAVSPLRQAKGSTYKSWPDKEFCFPLHMAVRAGKYDVVEFLIEKGAKVDVFNRWGQTPLHIAAAKSRLDLMGLLIKKGARTDMMGKNSPEVIKIFSRKFFPRCYILQTAVKNGKLDVVEFLIKHRAHVNAIDLDGRSVLLCYAVLRGDPQILNVLLKAGATVHLHRTPAPISTNISLRSLFLMRESGIDEDPFFLAVRRCENIRIVEMLLAAGAKINEPIEYTTRNTTFGQDFTIHAWATTALLEAVKRGRKDIVELLLKNGAEVDVEDGNGTSILIYALDSCLNRANEYNEIIQLLLSHGVTIKNHKTLESNLKNQEENPESSKATPTLCGTQHRYVEVLKCLLDSGLFDVDDVDGLDLDYEQEFKEFVEPLLFADIGIPGRPRESSPNSVTIKPGCNVESTSNVHQNAYRAPLVQDFPDGYLQSSAKENPRNNIGTMLCSLYRNNQQARQRKVPEFCESWSDQRKLLHFVGQGDYDQVKKLIVRGTQVNYRHKDGTISGTSCLHLAVQKIDLKLTRMLLDAGAELNVFNKWGHTPLHVAVSKDLQIVKLLITRGADVNAVDADAPLSEGCYPLHMAVRAGKGEAVEYLIENGADVDAPNLRAHTALHIAASKRLDLVELLIKGGANVNAFHENKKNSSFLLPDLKMANIQFESLGANPKKISGAICTKGCYPLHVAVSAAKLSIVKLLIKHGANVNATDVDGRSILYYAVDRNTGEILDLLLKNGARFDPDDKPDDQASEISSNTHDTARNSVDQDRILSTELNRVTPSPACIQPISKISENNPLMLAAGKLNKISVVKMLLNAGPRIYHRRETVALQAAVKWGHKNIIELLLRRGANVNSLDEDGISVLAHATLMEHNPDVKDDDYNEVLQLLFSYGAKARDDSDTQAILRCAIKRGNTFTLRLLHRRGLKLAKLKNVKDSYNPPLHLALFNRDVNVLRHLLNSTLFNVNEQDSDGNTALYKAVQHKLLMHTRILLEWQANPNLLCSNSRTPLNLAVDKKDKNFVETLLFAGSDITNPSNMFLLCHGVSENTLIKIKRFRNRAILQHVVKHFALVNVVHHRHVNLDEYPIPVMILDDPGSIQLYKECLAEAKIMKNTILCGQITFFDIFPPEGFTTCIKKIQANYVVSKDVLEECFPIYGKQMRQRLIQIFRAQKIRDEAVKGLSILLRQNLEPYHLIHSKIFDYLDGVHDLRHLKAIGFGLH